MKIYIMVQICLVVNNYRDAILINPFIGTDEDLEYYVRECGDILSVTTKLPQEKRDAKNILEYIFAQVVEFKKLNQVYF